MAEITASAVKELRERTGAGMMDCKKALTEAAGDMEAAIDWLRKKGLSAAAKKPRSRAKKKDAETEPKASDDEAAGTSAEATADDAKKESDAK